MSGSGDLSGGPDHPDAALFSLCISAEEIMRIEEMIRVAVGPFEEAKIPDLHQVVDEIRSRLRPVCDRFARDCARFMGVDLPDTEADLSRTGLDLARLLKEADPRIHGSAMFLFSGRAAFLRK